MENLWKILALVPVLFLRMKISPLCCHGLRKNFGLFLT
jgi:hypothetical protein